MTDITLCDGIKKLLSSALDTMVVCPKKDTCYRYSAPASARQSWFMDAPFDAVSGECEYWIGANEDPQGV